MLAGMPYQYWFSEDHLPLPMMDHTPGWKPSAYHWRIGREILRRMAKEETIRSISLDPNMPSYATIFRWVKMIPEFGDDYRALRAELREEARTRWAERRIGKVKWAQVRAQVDGKRWWRRGRPSSYTRAMGRKICARLARGTTMSKINATPGYPSAKVVYRWLKTQPEFAAMVTEARAECRRYMDFKAKLQQDRMQFWFEVPRAEMRDAKRKLAKVEGRAGRLTPKVWG